ncbi:MAG: Crp/Fnr family transcriptional regulator [Chitinophagaceae bacterium]|nr:MAG: Crp/Fnr family transcriptional regulator [Chitinophagaceae bacterium]
MTNKLKTTVRTIWNTPDHHSPLSTFFNMVHPLSGEAIRCIDENSHPIEIGKGKFLIKPSQEAPELFLILSGVVRGYIKEEGKEITTWINEENDVVASIRNLGLRIPSKEYVQAIENCSLVSIPYEVIEHLYASFPETNVVGRKLLEENYRGAEERAYICRIPSAEKKYKRFMDTNPGLINRVSLKYIASYLNMTNETLSRVRRRFPASING